MERTAAHKEKQYPKFMSNILRILACAISSAFAGGKPKASTRKTKSSTAPLSSATELVWYWKTA